MKEFHWLRSRKLSCFRKSRSFFFPFIVTKVDTPFHGLALKMLKEVRRITTVKRAMKSMKKDGLDDGKISKILAKSREIEKEDETSSESDDSIADSRTSPR